MADKITVGSATSSTSPPPSIDDQIKQKQLELLEAQLSDARLQRQLNEIELIKHQESLDKKAEIERLRKARAESLAKDSISTAALTEREQNACSHLNQKGPDTVSSFDYNQQLIMVCQACGKQWSQAVIGDKFPLHLVNRDRKIGAYGME